MEIDNFKTLLKMAESEYPYPIAMGCRRYLEMEKAGLWEEWGLLSREVLQGVLPYVSHIVLSDLAAGERRPAHLYHMIQNVLIRPMAGHYAGFLRETARYWKSEGYKSQIPELMDFLYQGEVDASLTKTGDQLIGKLVDFRNLYAHGRIENEEVVREILEKVRELTGKLVEGLSFLKNYRLEFEDRRPAMGISIGGGRGRLRMVLKGNEGLDLMPLLVKLKADDLVLLEDHDFREMKLVYKGSRSFEKLGKKETKGGEGKILIMELEELMKKVRSIEAVLPSYEWNSFRDRASIITERTLSSYKEMRKYVPELFVPWPEWEGENGIFAKYLASPMTLLAINGVQGTGKSALVSYLASKSMRDGHCVMLINAHRFSNTDVTWSANPYAEYFSKELRFEKPLNKKSIINLLKNSPDGKKLILFVDAINEVDGFDNKWNRFRAMDLLLEWISEVSVPGLKVVLSFRLEAYERFEYLKEDEIPSNLNDISFPGTNRSKPWVTELKPFDETQAKALYEKLQIMTEFGMSPDMSWPDIQTQLGSGLEEFITNPLLFKIFLRVHHREKNVQKTDQNDLFMKYAEKITGATEIARMSLWRRMIGFLRNGNITVKERFLKDLNSKMAEEGNAAILVERLRPKENKRDRRLAESFHDPRFSVIRELKEAGMLAEENIVFQKNDQEYTSRRVTCVGELMISALEGIARKVEKVSKIRTNVLVFLSCCIMLMIARTFTLRSYIPSIAYSKYAGFPKLILDLKNVLEKEYHYFFDITAILLLIYFAGMLFIHSEKNMISPKSIGAIEWAYMNKRDKAFLLSAYQWLSIIIIFLFLAGLVISQRSADYSDVLLFFIFSLVIIAAITIIYAVYKLQNMISIDSLPVRIQKVALSHISEVYLKKNNVHNYARLKKTIILFIYCVFSLLFYWILFPLLYPTISSNTVSATNIYGFMKVIQKNGSMAIIFIFMVYVILNWLWEPIFSRKTGKIYRFLAGSNKTTNVRSSFFKIFIFAIETSLITIICSISIVEILPRTEIDKFVRAGFLEAKIALNDKRMITALDLRNIKPGKRAIYLVNDVRNNLIELEYSEKWPAIDLSNYPKLETLTAPPFLVRNLEKSHVRQLSLTDCERIEALKSNEVKTLALPFACDHVKDIGIQFPNLDNIIVDETTAILLNIQEGVFKKDLQLILSNFNSPPFLYWLTPEIGERIILRINSNPPLDQNTENIQNINKLAINLRSKAIAEPLRNAVNLQVLKILIWETENKISFLEDLKELIKNALPNMKELILENGGENGGELKACGKKEALDIIDQAILLASKGSSRIC